MFLNFNIVLLTVFLITFVENQFFKPYYTIGKFPKYNLSSEVNHPECGLRYVSGVQTIRFNKSCFVKNISDKIVYDFQWNHFGSQRNSPKIPLTRILYGERASHGEAPWTVLLKYVITKNIYFHTIVGYCTGVLISLEWVLTAAHCKEPWYAIMLVQAGTTTYDIEIDSDLNEFDIGRRSWVSKWIADPVYLKLNAMNNLTNSQEGLKHRHDIALIKLEEPFERLHGEKYYRINPICLPARVKRNKDPLVTTVFGFGNIESDETPDFLQKSRIVLNNLDCGSRLVLCAKYTDNYQPRTCDGDSGGPLVYYVDKHNVQATLIGTTIGSVGEESWIKLNECQSKYRTKTFWTFVPKFVDWILDTISKN